MSKQSRRTTTVIKIIDLGETIEFSIKSPDRREIKLTFHSPAEFIFYLKRTIAAMEIANKPKPNSKLNGGAHK